MGASYSSDEVCDIMSAWVSMSDSQRESTWDNMSAKEHELILSQVNENGQVDASLYGVNDPHSDEYPSWCICEEDTGVRSIVVNDDSYEKTFEKVLAPKGGSG